MRCSRCHSFTPHYRYRFSFCVQWRSGASHYDSSRLLYLKEALESLQNFLGVGTAFSRAFAGVMHKLG